MQYSFDYSKLPQDDEYLIQESTTINDDTFTYFAIRDVQTKQFKGVSSDMDGLLSMALSQNDENQDLKQMLAQSTASNAKSDIDIQNLKGMLAQSTSNNAKNDVDMQNIKQQNADLTQQIAQLQIQLKGGK